MARNHIKSKIICVKLVVGNSSTNQGKDITVRSEYKASYDSKNNKVELSLIKSERLWLKKN